jgi:hypothetical protein
MKTLFATALVVFGMLACTPKVSAFDGMVNFNPGVKLGYTFGKQGGFTFGFEVSLTTNFTNKQIGVWSGVVLDVDFCEDWTRIHTGFEASALGVGCDVGPSFILRNDTISYGVSIIPFLGVVAYPYYNYSYFENGLELHEVGSYFKLSMMVAGEPFRLF